MNEKPKFMTHERIMAGEEYVSYSDYLMLQRERDEAREALRTLAEHGEIEIQKLIKERDEAIRLLKLCADYTITTYQEEAEEFLKRLEAVK